MVYRIIFFLGVLGLTLFSPWYTAAIGVLSYALMYPAYGFIVIGALIDAQFGGATGFGFLYTLLFAGILVVAEFTKPHLTFYNPEQI